MMKTLSLTKTISPKIDGALNISQDEESDAFTSEESEVEENDFKQEKINQDEISDLCRDLGLSKDKSELLT